MPEENQVFYSKPTDNEVIKTLTEENKITTEKIKRKLDSLSREQNKIVLTAFVQRAIDEKRIVMSDRIFSFIDEYLKYE